MFPLECFLEITLKKGNDGGWAFDIIIKLFTTFKFFNIQFCILKIVHKNSRNWLFYPNFSCDLFRIRCLRLQISPYKINGSNFSWFIENKMGSSVGGRLVLHQHLPLAHPTG